MAQSNVLQHQHAFHVVARRQILLVLDHVPDHLINIIYVILSRDWQVLRRRFILLVVAQISDLPPRLLIGRLPPFADIIVVGGLCEACWQLFVLGYWSDRGGCGS